MSIIQGLWVGNRLGPVEILSIRSFLHHGHTYHLYTYGEIENVPDGVIVKDGGEILDPALARRDRFGTFTFFADRFRYRMLLRKGGWWVDTDVLCVRPFDFAEEYVFGFEGTDESVNNAVMKAPAGSPLMQLLDANAFYVDEHVTWGVIGPKLLTAALRQPMLEPVRRFIRPMESFYHYTFPDWEKLFKEEHEAVEAAIPPGVYGIHLGATMHSWCKPTDLDQIYPQRTIIGFLQHRYLSPAAPPPVAAPSARQIFDAAGTALSQGRVAEAIAGIKHAIALDPADFTFYHALGDAWLHRGEQYESLLGYMRACRIAETDVAAMMRSADLYALNGRWRDSEGLARIVAGRIGDDPGPLFVQGLSLYNLDRPAEAAAVFERALKTDPNRLNARAYLGLCRRELGDLAGALDSFSLVTGALHSTGQVRSNIIFGEAFFNEALLSRLLGGPPVSAHARRLAEDALAEARREMEAERYGAAARALVQSLTLWPDGEDAAAAAVIAFARWEEQILTMGGDLGHRHNEWFAHLAGRAEMSYHQALIETPAFAAPAAFAAGAAGSVAGPTPPGPRRVFDGFMLSEELDILELRLTELDDCVDYFILVESPWTHQGTPKRLAYAETRERFHRFNHKIIHVVAEEMMPGLTMHQDNYQRDCIGRGLGDARDGDVVLISDLDEIPRKDVVRAIAANDRLAGRLLVLSMALRPYFVNFESFDPWTKTVAVPVGLARRLGTNQCRSLTLRPPAMQIAKVLYDAGWHLTWMGGAEAIIRKYRSYAHTEMAAIAPSAEEIREAVASGAIIRHAYRKGDWIDHTRSCPDTILADPERYRALGWIREPLNRARR